MTTERSFAEQYLSEVADIASQLPAERLEAMASGLAGLKERRGRLFVVGVGGGAGHASHAVNDFRKLCGLEAYAPTDNVSELTARTNDEGWRTTFTEWLKVSRLSQDDALLVFSVGGGSAEHDISANVALAVELAVQRGAQVYGIVGRSDGTTAQLASTAVVIHAPPERLTPHVEAFQAVLWHLLVSHPLLAARAGKWEEEMAG